MGYAPHTSLIGSLAQRRRVFWNLKGFWCKCPWCCHEEVQGDHASSQSSVQTWQVGADKPFVGSSGFVGTQCDVCASAEVCESEVQLSSEVMCLVMRKPFWERLEMIGPLWDRVSE